MSFFSFEIKIKANIESEQISKRILFAEKKRKNRVCTFTFPAIFSGIVADVGADMLDFGPVAPFITANPYETIKNIKNISSSHN